MKLFELLESTLGTSLDKNFLPLNQITTFIKVHVAFVFGLHTLQLKDYIKIY